MTRSRTHQGVKFPLEISQREHLDTYLVKARDFHYNRKELAGKPKMGGR